MTSRTSRWRSRAIVATIALGIPVGAVATGMSSARAASGTFTTAVRGSGGNLALASPAFTGLVATGLAMAPGPSPSIQAVPGSGDGYVIAFQADTQAASALHFPEWAVLVSNQ